MEPQSKRVRLLRTLPAGTGSSSQEAHRLQAEPKGGLGVRGGSQPEPRDRFVSLSLDSLAEWRRARALDARVPPAAEPSRPGGGRVMISYHGNGDATGSSGLPGAPRTTVVVPAGGDEGRGVRGWVAAGENRSPTNKRRATYRCQLVKALAENDSCRQASAAPSDAPHFAALGAGRHLLQQWGAAATVGCPFASSSSGAAGSPLSFLRGAAAKRGTGIGLSPTRCYGSTGGGGLDALSYTPKHLFTFAGPPVDDNFYFNTLDWSCHHMLALGTPALALAWPAALRPSVVEQPAPRHQQQGDPQRQPVWRRSGPSAAFGGGAASGRATAGAIRAMAAAQSRRVPACLTSAPVTSVQWDATGERLTVGQRDGQVLLWAVETGQELQRWAAHSSRVDCLRWSSQVLATGAADAQIRLLDARLPPRSAPLAAILGHRRDVCGLSFAPGSHALLASGSDDNSVALWDVRFLRRLRLPVMAVAAAAGGSSRQREAGGPPMTDPVLRLTAHQAAVKALAWNPQQRHLLATGGGTADRSIRLWNTQRAEQVLEEHTGAQVTGLAWSPLGTQLVSSGGYLDNGLTLWTPRGESLRKEARLEGHSERILHLAPSPDGQRVATAAADRSIRTWLVFGDEHRQPGLGRLPSSLQAMGSDGK